MRYEYITQTNRIAVPERRRAVFVTGTHSEQNPDDLMDVSHL